MADSFEYNGIWIIESLKCHKTGRRLSEDLGVLESKHQGLKVEYREVTSSNDLFSLLGDILTKVQGEGHAPILHFELHGDEEGISLQDDSIVSWAQLTAHTGEINAATAHNLLVVVAACWGAFLVKATRHDRRAPFHALVGPKEEITADVIEHDFVRFYKTMIASGDIEAAAAQLSAGRPDPFRPLDLIAPPARLGSPAASGR